MERESHGIDAGSSEEEERKRRREALDVLLEARDRLLAQMTEDVLSHRELILDGSGEEGLFRFDLEEIEDRYSARLNALNSLLENLEYRNPRIKHRVETLTTTPRALKKDLSSLLARMDQWDLVDLHVAPLDGEEMLVVVALTADEYPD
jgi:hypothetical protein